ncbi:ATP-binding protein [Rhodoferax aquaticus]|uniref:Sensory/regulatory protein RpfC n=1 Tax=Rhodoferax aquaticus TaxID=2527691 RepID=A0A515EUF4_9BURK|nr:ATP-binding protein [Rhodoferax aquaticus]QDL56314.1 response regulator [Rhodoferax aquaticus]
MQLKSKNLAVLLWSALKNHTTRAFAALTFVVLSVALALTWKLLVQSNQEGIVNATKAASMAITEVMVSEAWNEIRPLLLLDEESVVAIKANPYMDQIDAAVRKFSRQTDIVKVKIFDLRGVTQYSSEFRQIGENKAASSGFSSAVQGVATSELSFRQSFESFGRTLQEVNLVSSYVPVVEGENRVAVLEIYTDRSSEFAHMRAQQWGLLLGLGAIYVVLYVVLLFVFWSSERARLRHVGSLQELATQNESARLAAEQNTRLKSQFLATMSHEIRTPMNGVIGMAHLLAETPLTPVQSGYVHDIVNSGESLLAIINDILDISKIEAGKMEFEHATFDLPELVQSVHALLMLRADQKGIGLHVDLDDASTHCFVGDALRTRQVLLNLVSNAVKFTDHGQVNITVQRQAAGVRFSVSDTGIGMDAQEVAQLFQSFTQVDGSATRRFGGTGLGLAISKKLVEGMQGAIGVDSHKGVGTTFYFDLPLQIDPSRSAVMRSAPAANAPKSLMAVPAAAPSDAAPKVMLVSAAPMVKGKLLLVEDHPVNQKLAATLLQRMGFEVDIAQDGSLGVDMAERQRYDAILMDVQMPVMNGLEATRAIRQGTGQNQGGWIIGLTANAMESDREECLSAGMNDFLSKPLRKEDLTAAVSRIPKAIHPTP